MALQLSKQARDDTVTLEKQEFHAHMGRISDFKFWLSNVYYCDSIINL